MNDALIKLKSYAIYLFVFSLNFETMNLFNLGVDYLASKISIIILLAVSILNLIIGKSSGGGFFKYLSPLLIYFAWLTFISIVNIGADSNFFYFSFFLNIVILFVLINFSLIQPNILVRSLFIFAISTFILSLLYFSGIATTATLEGRPTIFGMNQNHLGIGICVSIFVILSVVFENKLNLGKGRYNLLLMLPLLLVFMINTGSRVAFLSLVGGVSFFLYFRRAISPFKKGMIISMSVIALLLFWQFYLKNSFLAERLSDTVNDGDLANRDLIWLELFDVITSNVYFGIGRTGFASLFGGASPHNVIIEILCYTGVVGLFIFLIFIFRLIGTAYKRNKQNGELLPIVLVIPFLGIVLSGQILEQKYIWIIVAYILSSSQKVKEVTFKKTANV